jgi:5'-nucleotidase
MTVLTRQGFRLWRSRAEFRAGALGFAPEEDQSGASQRISLRRALGMKKYGERSWSVKGTPSDCVALALDHLMREEPPSLVLSGINATTNVGDEINLSGTVGAAMTALMMGIPAIAISQDGPSRKEIPWDTSKAVLPLVLRRVLAE